MVKTNTSQIITMVAIFAVLIGLIIFMRRNDEKEGFSRAAKAAMDRAQKAAKDAAKRGDRDAAARGAEGGEGYDEEV
jgi:hypothetical protein